MGGPSGGKGGAGRERQNRGWSQQRRQEWRPELLSRLQTCEAELWAEEEQLAVVQTQALTEEEQLAFVQTQLQEKEQELAAANFSTSLESSIWQDEVKEQAQQLAESRSKAELLDASEARLRDLESLESEHVAESRSTTELLEASNGRLRELEVSETRLLRRESEWEELEDLECQRAEKHKATAQSERRKKINCRDELAQSNEELAQSNEELAKSKEELAESQRELSESQRELSESNAEMKDEKKACLALRLELAARMMKLHISETSAAVGVSGSLLRGHSETPSYF